MNTKFIYTLSDPNTGLVRYIGKTNNIRKRLSSHLSNNHLSSSTKKNNWIISLLRNSQIPVLMVVMDMIGLVEIIKISQN